MAKFTYLDGGLRPEKMEKALVNFPFNEYEKVLMNCRKKLEQDLLRRFTLVQELKRMEQTLN